MTWTPPDTPMPNDPSSRPIDFGTLIVVAGAAFTLLGSFVRLYKIGDIGWSVWTIDAAPGLFGVGTLIPGFAGVAALAAVLRSFGGLGERRIAGFDLMQVQLVAVAFAVIQWLGFAVGIFINGGSEFSPDFDPGLGLLLMFVGLAIVLGGTALSKLGGQIPGLGGASAGDSTVTNWPGATAPGAPAGAPAGPGYPPAPSPQPGQPGPQGQPGQPVQPGYPGQAAQPQGQWPTPPDTPSSAGPFPVPGGQPSGAWPQQKAPAPQPDWQQPQPPAPPAPPHSGQWPEQAPPSAPPAGAAPTGPPPQGPPPAGPPPQGGPIDPGTQVIPGPPPAPPQEPPDAQP